MRLPEAIVLILTVIVLGKSVFCLFRPDSAQKLVAWWLKAPPAVFRGLGIVCVLGGLVLVAFAVSRIEAAAIAAINIAGTVLLFVGLAYLRPALMQAALRPFSPDGRRVTLRAAAVAGLAVGVLLLVVFIRAVQL